MVDRRIGAIIWFTLTQNEKYLNDARSEILSYNLTKLSNEAHLKIHKVETIKWQARFCCTALVRQLCEQKSSDPCQCNLKREVCVCV